MISKKQRFSICYFMTRALFLGMGISLATNITNQDTWISCILGTLLGYIIIYVNHQILKKKKDKTLKEVLKDMKWIGWIIRVFFILLAFVIILQNLVLLEIFTTSFFLIKTPPIMISLTIMAMVIYLSFQGIKVIGRVSECLFPISLIINSIGILALAPTIQIENFLPILTSSTFQILKSSFIIAIIGATPYVLFTQTTDDGWKMPLGYGFGMVSILTVVILVIGVLGIHLVNIYRFPEYMVLKTISLFEFIEKVENFICVVWIFDMFILLSMAATFLKDLLPKKKNTVWFLAIMIGTMLLSSFVFNLKYYLDLIIFYIYYIIVGVLFVLTSVPVFLHLLRKKRSST